MGKRHFFTNIKTNSSGEQSSHQPQSMIDSSSLPPLHHHAQRRHHGPTTTAFPFSLSHSCPPPLDRRQRDSSSTIRISKGEEDSPCRSLLRTRVEEVARGNSRGGDSSHQEKVEDTMASRISTVKPTTQDTKTTRRETTEPGTTVIMSTSLPSSTEYKDQFKPFHLYVWDQVDCAWRRTSSSPSPSQAVSSPPPPTPTIDWLRETRERHATALSYQKRSLSGHSCVVGSPRTASEGARDETSTPSSSNGVGSYLTSLYDDWFDVQIRDEAERRKRRRDRSLDAMLILESTRARVRELRSEQTGGGQARSLSSRPTTTTSIGRREDIDGKKRRSKSASNGGRHHHQRRNLDISSTATAGGAGNRMTSRPPPASSSSSTTTKKVSANINASTSDNPRIVRKRKLHELQAHVHLLHLLTI